MCPSSAVVKSCVSFQADVGGRRGANEVIKVSPLGNHNPREVGIVVPINVSNCRVDKFPMAKPEVSVGREWQEYDCCVRKRIFCRLEVRRGAGGREEERRPCCLESNLE